MVVLLCALRWHAITLCDMENITIIGSRSSCVHFHRNGTNTCFRHMIIKCYALRYAWVSCLNPIFEIHFNKCLLSVKKGWINASQH